MPTMRALNEMAEERLAICRTCARFDPVLVRCRKCGCFMHGKTRFPNAKCPVGLWGKDDIKKRDQEIKLRELEAKQAAEHQKAQENK